jgi:transforming acidic coiled-coil-containing protein 3
MSYGSHINHISFFRANETLSTLQRRNEAEIAKMHAMLRKAEMRVNSLERTCEQKSRENTELTKICDELIAQVGET